MSNCKRHLFDQKKKGDTPDLAQAQKGDILDGYSLDMDDLRDVSGGGMFNEIVKSSSTFRPQSSDEQKKNFGL